MKTAVIGIGGVGGFIGGMLARKYPNVHLMARGHKLEVMRQHGLRVKSDVFGEFVVWPQTVTDDPHEIGIVDCMIVAVKGYSLDLAVKAIVPTVGEKTIVLPLLNGVNVSKRIWDMGCSGWVAEGCTYVLSKSEEDGVIVHSDTARKALTIFGDATRRIPKSRLLKLESYLKGAFINAEYTEDIRSEIWRKFILVNAAGGSQVYYGMSSFDIGRSKKRLDFARGLAGETAAIARASGVKLDQKVVEDTILILQSARPNSESSFKRDVSSNRENEKDTLIAEVVRLGRTLRIPTPHNERVMKLLG
jgi:2-dehydropantoate 2-reductase